MEKMANKENFAQKVFKYICYIYINKCPGAWQFMSPKIDVYETKLGA